MLRHSALLILFVVHASACLLSAQTRAVLKNISGNTLTENLVVPSGKTLTIDGAITNNGTATGFGGGAFSTLSDVTLTSIASGDFLKWNGTAWINRTAADARSDLGLGTIATQAASAVAITGGTLSGITSLAIANTGTLNATSAASLRLPSTAIGTSSALSLVSIANGGSGYELHYGDKDGGDRTLMTLDYAQTPTNKTISGATNTITDLNASNLASGTVATARLGSGTADGTTYLRGDGTWATLTGGATLAANTFTGVQTLAAGSVSAPSLTMTGMTADTGMYSTGTADEIAFAIGGVQRLKITNNLTTISSGDSVGGIFTLAGFYGSVPFAIGGTPNLYIHNMVIIDPSAGFTVYEYFNGANNLTFKSTATHQYIYTSSARFCVGIPSATPAAHTLSGPEGVGTNITGGTLYIGTRGTGTGTSGAIVFQTHAAGVSSATPGTLSARLTINELGEIIPVLPTSAAGLTTGALWNDSGTVKVAP